MVGCSMGGGGAVGDVLPALLAAGWLAGAQLPKPRCLPACQHCQHCLHCLCCLHCRLLPSECYGPCWCVCHAAMADVIRPTWPPQ